jgi:hypothetical protein
MIPALLAEYTRPFLQPLPVWNQWYILLLPLCLCVSIVYKAIKCRSMKQVPRQAIIITVWIIVSFAAAGAAIAGFVRIIEVTR